MRSSSPQTDTEHAPVLLCSATASTSPPAVAHPQGRLLRSVAHLYHRPSPGAPGTAQHTSDADGRGVPLAASRGRRASTDATASEASSLVKPRGRLSHPEPIIQSSLSGPAPSTIAAIRRASRAESVLRSTPTPPPLLYLSICATAAVGPSLVRAYHSTTPLSPPSRPPSPIRVAVRPTTCAKKTLRSTAPRPPPPRSHSSIGAAVADAPPSAGCDDDDGRRPMRPSRHHCRRVPIYPPGPGSHRGKSGMGGGALAQAASMAVADSCSGSSRPFGPYNASGGGGCCSRCAATPASPAAAAGVTAGTVAWDAAAASGAMVAGGGADGGRPRPAGGAPG